MSRQQKLVDAILEDGRKEAQKLLKKVQKQSQQLLEEKQLEEQKFFDEQMQLQKNENNTKIENQKSSQNLQKTKILLGVKNEVLQEVFDLALKKLKNLDAKQRKTFFEKALNFAESGNSVVVANEDDKKLIQKLAIFKSKKLKFEKDLGAFSGGIIIVSKTKEIDFSFESLLLQKFETQKFNIAEQLF